MSFNSRDFTQGGQVMKYMIQMFIQIMNIATYWVLMFSVLIFLAWMLIKLTLQEFCHGCAYWLIKYGVMPLKSLSGKTPANEWTFHFTRANGDVVTFRHTAAQVMTDPYFINMGQLVKNTAFYGWGIGCAAFVGAIMVITWYLGSKGRKQRQSETTGGRILATGPRVINSLLKKAGLLSPLNICGLHLVKDSEMQNFGLHGTVGSGKSTALNNLLKQLRERGDRVIIYDKGNNFIPLFYRQDKDKLLNALDVRCANWDLWSECRTITDFENFATTLLPDSGGSSDPFWVLSARSMFVVAAMRMAKDPDRTIAGLLKKLMSISMDDLREFLKGTDAANLVDQSVEKTAMTIRIILSTYVRSLRYLQGLSERGMSSFNIRDWLATEDAAGDNPWIFLSSDGPTHAAIKPLLSAWLYITMTGVLGLQPSRSRRIWFILDELPSLHKMPILPEFCAEARKFGGCTLVAIQNFPQLEEIYGQYSARSIWDLLNTRMFYRAPSGEVAGWVQKEVGEQRFKKFKDQYSYGMDTVRDGVQFSKDEVNEFLLSYSDVQSLNDLECYVTLPGEWPVVKMKLKREEFREIATGHISRDLKKIFDPELEAALENDHTSDELSSLIEKVFNPPKPEAAKPGSTDQAGASGDAMPPAGSPPSATTTTASAQDAPEGRQESLSPPDLNGSGGEAPAVPETVTPPAAVTEPSRLQVMDVRPHNAEPDFSDRW
ncbi:type IV conjugative transfer system coupling protein TraD [Candidatus Pantoea multigeneris]|uniref:Type IV conjugative transfer system coupling protein TraD n=1 Tax=Candidatus Pantoea multigeneris TaxID=2608357 RepID=A0ABX0RF09_9GAMM|nr:type IV conjugative transfer system coupling protein TraD [Pantoea multigeneris]NIF23933.1 type IV conjugative transfer system coupling protein TraD [Pantoea multigeneris]